MIQRIQSLLLLGVALVSIALFFLPFSEKVTSGTGSEAGTIFQLTLKGTNSTESTTPAGGISEYVLMVVNILLLVLSVFTIFMYRNRSLQIRLCMFGSLLATVFLILIFYYSENMGPESVRPHYLEGVYLVAVQTFLLLGARRFIRKDEMLVRAADRIR